MFCKECGKVIDDDSKFCSYCGMKQFSKQVPENQSVLYSSSESKEHISENQPDLNAKPEPINQNFNISLSFKKPSSKTKKEVSVKEEKKIAKYDSSYKRENNATIIGIIVLIVLSIILVISRELDDPFFITIYKVFFIIWWIISIIWVVKIAKRQNRNCTGWGLFAFFLPFLAIIIIGLLKKLNKYNNEPVPSFNRNISRNLEIGSSGIVTYESVRDKITYKIIAVENVSSFWNKGHIEYQVEFSDGNAETLYFSNNRNEYYFLMVFGEKYYYNKEEAINALHYFLCFGRALAKGSC